MRYASLIDRATVALPWAEASSTELDSNALDIRRTSITELDCNLGECDVLEMPAPPRVD
jgi:hypothetical protein